MSHTPLVRRIAAKLATLAAVLGVLALTLAPTGAATAQDEPDCPFLVTVTLSAFVLADLGVDADAPCFRAEVNDG